MPRKKRTPGQGRALPLSTGEVWEAARCPLDVTVGTLDHPGPQPEIILVLEVGTEARAMQVHLADANDPPGLFAEIVRKAMQTPLEGQPRRPAVIRVASPVEAELLAVLPDMTGVVLEVAGELPTVQMVQTQMAMQMAGLNSDYRTQAARVGEMVSPEALRAFFQRARQFYRQAMWEGYGDDTIFTVTMQPATGEAWTVYGVLIGELGQEMGLVLYPDLATLERFYTASLEHDELWDEDEAEMTETQQAEAMAHLLQSTSLALTYTPQRDVAPAMLTEAKQLKLPTANKAAFPLVMRTGGGGLRTATARELADMYVALGALLDWEARIDAQEAYDETDVTLTWQEAAMADFVPALTVQTGLLDNPFLPELPDDEDDEDGHTVWLEAPPALAEMLDTLFPLAPESGSGTRQGAPSRQAPISVATPVYTLDVHLAAGPVSAAYAHQEIRRRIEILGSQTLQDLHQAIFDAFERWEQQPYVFNLGTGPTDRSQLYASKETRQKTRHPNRITLDTLQLDVGRQFGYTFDNETWEHVVEVRNVKDARGQKPYPRLTQQVGQAPPQYDLGEPN